MLANPGRWKPHPESTYLALGVLGGAYRGKDIGERETLTHLVEARDGSWVGDKTVCRRVPLDHIVDEGSAGASGGAEMAEPPTCSVCLGRYETVVATIGYAEHQQRAVDYYNAIFGEHERNAGSYYVWVVRGDTPLDEGPYGPFALAHAKTYARISATEGKHDRAVSRGRDAAATSFEFVRRYRAGTGERIL